MNQNQDLKYWHAINKIEQIGPSRFKKLYNFFPSMELAFFADFKNLKKAGFSEKIADLFTDQRRGIDPDKEFERLLADQIEIITIKDKNYPKLLKEIYNPPALLYIRGNLKKQDEFAVAVVGTRKPSNYGRQVVPMIVQDLTENKITIVSGLAMGIDSLSQETCLASGGRTIAVLGSGVDNNSIYPRINYNLAQEIIKNGALVSEYPPGTDPRKEHFPARNRIISGLCLGVLVIEAGESSGALITAHFALDQNREVFSTPGNIFSPNSFGTNNLIKKGAKLVTSSQDVLDELNLSLATEYVKTQSIIPDTPEEAEILKNLSHEPTHVDKIIKKTKLPVSKVNSTLSMMELKGKVKNLGNANYVLSH